MDQVNFYRVCLDCAHTSSSCLRICNQEIVIQMRARRFHEKPSRHTNDKPDERSAGGAQGRHQFRQRCFSTPDGSKRHRDPSTRESDSWPDWSQGITFHSGPSPRCLTRAQYGQLDRARILKAKYPGRASSPVAILTRQRHAALNDCPNVPLPAAVTILPADTKSGDRLELDDTDVIALSKKNNYKLHRCVGITSNISRPAVSVFDTGAALHISPPR